MKEQNELKIKALAEQHILLGKDISKTQFDIIKRSKYGKYLKEKTHRSKFEKIMESALDTQEANEQDSSVYDNDYSKYGFGFSFLEREYVNHIIQLLENKFDIGPLNKNFEKYDSIDFSEVVNYLRKVLVSFENKCAYTSSRIEEIIKDSNDTRNLIFGLRTLLA